MKTALQKNNAGSTLLYVIASLVILGAAVAGMSNLTTRSAMTQAQNDQGARARLMALSGINYAKTLDGDALDALVASGEDTFTLSGDESFTLTVTGPAGSIYTVNSEGNVDVAGPREAHFKFVAEVEPGSELEWVGWPEGQEPPVVFGQNMALILSNVEGNISSASDLYVGAGIAIKGNICAVEDVTVSIGADVSGNVEASGNVDVEYSVDIHGDITAGGDVTLTGARILFLTLDVWVGGDVTAGGEINKNAYVTIEGDEREYVPADISCASIELPPFREVPASAPSAPEGGIGLSEDNPFLGGEDYFYQTFNFSGENDLYFDLSDGDFAVFVEGDIRFAWFTRFHVKETEDGEWRTFNSYPGESFKDAAAAMYFESHGSATIGYGTYWLGTIYAEGEIDISLLPGAYGQFVSHDEGFNLDGLSNITYVGATYWNRLTD